jgi:hypothetical protein
MFQNLKNTKINKRETTEQNKNISKGKQKRKGKRHHGLAQDT